MLYLAREDHFEPRKLREEQSSSAIYMDLTVHARIAELAVPPSIVKIVLLGLQPKVAEARRARSFGCGGFLPAEAFWS
jgi:hypothetical protein